MSHSASRTWISDETKQHEAYRKVSGHFHHIAPKSPFLPTSFKECLAHQEAMIEQDKADKQREIQKRETYKARRGGCRKRREDPKPAFDVTKFNDGRSSVLAMQSIWVSRCVEQAKPHADWPTNDELKHHGTHRVSSGQCRTLPHPRRDADPSVKWNERPLVALFPLDDSSPDEGGNNTINTTDGELSLGVELLKELDR